MAKQLTDRQLLKTLKNAYQTCGDCGDAYGEYHDGVSSVWEGKCDVCGETKPVTEVRDYRYFRKGIIELQQKIQNEKSSRKTQVQQG